MSCRNCMRFEWHIVLPFGTERLVTISPDQTLSLPQKIKVTDQGLATPDYSLAWPDPTGNKYVTNPQ